MLPTMGLPVAHDPDSGGVTIGVSLQIPEPYATVLQQSRDSFGDPLARAVPAHVTLLPPTQVRPDQIRGILAHLTEVAAGLKPFELRLEGTDTFRPVSPVVFVKVVRGGESCDAVQAAVRTGPLARELTFPFHPHVTVAHHLDDAALDHAMTSLAGFSATFLVDCFVLFEHGADNVWRPRHRFDFRTARP